MLKGLKLNMLRKGKYMKKILRLTVIGIFALLLVGCNNTTEENTGGIVNTNIRLFQDVMERGENVAIYIGRPTCPACVRLYPTIEEIGEEFEINFYYINLDEWDMRDFQEAIGSVVTDFRGTPTIVIMNDGEPIESIVGAHPRENVLDLLRRNDMID